MPFVVVAVAVAVLLVLMTKLKFNGFIALLLVAVAVAFVMGIPAGKIPEILADGVGGQIDETMLVIGLGAMIGRVMGDAGAAQRIAMKLVAWFGEKGVQAAMVVSAMLIGVTMFYEVAFVIIVPVAFTLARATRVNLLWVGLPMSIALSTMHSFLRRTPARRRSPACTTPPSASPCSTACASRCRSVPSSRSSGRACRSSRR